LNTAPRGLLRLRAKEHVVNNVFNQSFEDVDEFEEDTPIDDDVAAGLLQPDEAPDKPQLAPEPLFSLLLKDAIDPGDTVLRDYAEHVAPKLSALLGHVAAKGGDFVRDRLDAGASGKDVRRYGDDQTMRAHIVNGLLPTAQIARTLKRWELSRFEDEFDEATYRLFCAGFTLHDWLKLPEVDAKLQAQGLQHHTVNAAVHLDTVSSIIRHWCVTLGLDAFLAPLGSLDSYLHDLIYIACNTQLQWGVMHNLSALPGLRHRGRGILLATDLATLADYLAYLGRTPVDAVEHPSIQRMIERLDDGRIGVHLTYHHLADVRGVLTNIIHNAAIAQFEVEHVREPLLYAPTGVVYLTRADAPLAPQIEDVAAAVVQRIQAQGRTQLDRDLTGFSRDGKGLKYADYYNLFYSPAQLARLIPRYTERRMTAKSDAQKRYDSMRAKAMVPSDVDLTLPAYPEVDRIAETSALLVKLAATVAPDVDATGVLLDRLDAAERRPLVDSINSNKTAGGVPYGWYYVAGWYRQRTPGLDDEQWNAQVRDLAEHVAQHLPDTAPKGDGWDEIRRYVTDHLRFGGGTSGDLRERMQVELTRYSAARKAGRSSVVCSLCSSPYTVSRQQEAAILFAPMVYTNKQSLHSSNAIRHICAVCGMEMMLRQLLMKRGRESGGNFEKRRLRYLFFYPTYFFTPETLRMLRAMQDRLKRVSFTSLRTLLQPGSEQEQIGYNLQPDVYQRLSDLMLHPAMIERVEDDRLFRLRFPEHEPITFSFIGIPPAERDAKDAEAWIHPAFLALALPLVLDIKVVAAESMVPVMHEATELPETVAFDSAHAFVGNLTEPSRRRDERKNGPHTDRHTPGRFNIDEVLPALQRLTVGYFVHLDGNAKSGAGGFDYRWHEIGPLARNLATSPLYAFHYLKKSLRREGADAPSGYKAALYVDTFTQYLAKGDESMSHASELVFRYRRFYRHKRGRLNSNAILRPISEAADALLEADPRLFSDDEALREVVQGRLEKFIERVSKRGADGTIPGWIEPEVRQAALEEFAGYFVNTIYRDVFGGNRAALAGKQLNLLKNACESIYMAEQRREWRERNESSEDKQNDDE
jgi:CRISPR-associated protein Csc3